VQQVKQAVAGARKHWVLDEIAAAIAGRGQDILW